MQFAINTPNFDYFGDPRLLAELAHEAEESGWDGFFIWDHILRDRRAEIADPWVELTAMAMTTKRIKLGPMVTPLPRRRPWIVARQALTLDHLSNGRLILGVGIGHDFAREFSAFSESPDDKLHGEMLDEGLEILKLLWSGETISFEGKHYQLRDVQFLPKPVQYIPIWIAGYWPNKKPFRRAARWDGVTPIVPDSNITAEQVRDIISYMKDQRGNDTPFDLLVAGNTTGKDRAQDVALVTPYAEAGATWWQEAFDWNYTLDQVRERIRLGPPR